MEHPIEHGETISYVGSAATLISGIAIYLQKSPSLNHLFTISVGIALLGIILVLSKAVFSNHEEIQELREQVIRDEQ